MIRLFLRAVVASLGFWLASRAVPGVYVSTLDSLTATCAIVGVVNALVRPLAAALGLPANILTIGLSLIVANVITVEVADWALGGLEFSGLGPAVSTAIVISLSVWISGYFIDPTTQSA
jgi:putative membrane protein